MPLKIEDENIDRLAEMLAARLHTTKTEAVKIALENELGRLKSACPS